MYEIGPNLSMVLMAILTVLFILVLRRFSIFTINLSDKKSDTNVINNREQV